MKKTIGIFLCSAMLIAAIFSFGVSADEGADRLAAASKWDGTVYEVAAEEEIYTFEGTGKKANPYKINSADDLAKLAANVRYEDEETNYDGKYFELTCDIDMQNKEWWGIGGCLTSKGFGPQSENRAFCGNFNGLGHVIYNFNLADEDDDGKPLYYNGLFGHTGGAKISNVGIASGDVTVADTTRVAALIGAARYDLELENCFNKANITFTLGTTAPNDSDELRVGGLVGAVMNDNVAERSFINCYNAGNLAINAEKASALGAIGGIVGYISDGTNVYEKCYNTGNITMTTKSTVELKNNEKDKASMGGLIGSIAYGDTNTSHTFKGCAVGGTITFTLAATEASSFAPQIGAFTGFHHGMRSCALQDTNTYSAELTGGTIKTVGYILTYADDANYKFDAITAEYAKATATADTTVPLAQDNIYFMVAVDMTPTVPATAVTPEGESNSESENEAGNNAEEPDGETPADGEETTEDTEKRGCGSVIGGGAAALCAVLSCAVVLKKRKED